MPTYLIEIPHSENPFECKQVIKIWANPPERNVTKCKNIGSLWLVFTWS